MKRVGIYICNYNKSEYVVRCVDSLLNQTFQNQDVCVVDNASEDNSVACLRRKFKEKISIIQNPQNLGGSGGFNSGLKDGVEKGYEYIVLVDNDVWIDKKAIQTMYDYMENHDNVGILGPKILQMDNPRLVQDLGGTIDKEYHMRGNYYDEWDEDLPEELDCDYISTCTAMVRVKAMRQFGFMPEENFIYWDDVEWSKRCQLKGYGTVAISTAKVWHKHSIKGRDSSFVKYYLNRNRLKFFSKYLQGRDKKIFYEKIMEEIHTVIFMYRFKKEYDLADTVLHAWEDFLQGIYGKAMEGRILMQSPVKSAFDELLYSKGEIFLVWNKNEEEECQIAKGLLKKIRALDGPQNVVLVTEGLPSEEKENSVILRVCRHVKYQQDFILPQIYVDGYGHCIASKEDYERIRQYPQSYMEFKNKYKDSLMRKG